MNRIFADAGYWIALLNPSDELHSRALEISEQLGSVRIYTTEMVLVEVANVLGKAGGNFRALVQLTIVRIRENPDVAIEPQTSAQFDDALEHYAAHRDKDWSLTDCASFAIMSREGITEALAHDHHFQQAGFVALLRVSGK